MSTRSTTRELLDLWDRVAGLTCWDRDDALLRDCAPSSSLGARNRDLLRIRAQMFGDRWRLRSSCPACESTCEFEVGASQLARDLMSNPSPARVERELRVGAREYSYRLPCPDDLRAIARCVDEQQAVIALVRRCVTHDSEADVDADLCAAFSREVEAIDPGAMVAFALKCPVCAHAWHSRMDIGQVLWAEMQTAAERALVEIDTLARAYGWAEEQVLALSPTRRAAYLQLAAAHGGHA